MTVRLMAEVEVVVLNFDHGVGVLRRRKNKHPLPPEWVAWLSVSPISMLKYADLVDHRDALLRLIGFRELEAWLSD